MYSQAQPPLAVFAWARATPSARSTRRRWAYGLLLSLALNLVLLAGLLIGGHEPTWRLPQPTERALTVELRRDAAVPPVPSPTTTWAEPSSLRSIPVGKPSMRAAPRRPTIPALLSRPVPPPPIIAPSPSAQAAPQKGAQAGDDVQAKVRAALRGLGCAQQGSLGLTPTERENCMRMLNTDASVGARQWVDPISSPAKRAYYDAVQQSYQDIRTYNPVNGPMAGHGVSIGCKHGKCGVVLPQGVLTEEAGIPKP